MSERFLVTVDYQHAGYGFIVLAPDLETLETAIVPDRPDSGVEIFIGDAIDGHPLVQYLGDRISVYDLSSPAGSLEAMVREAAKYGGRLPLSH